MPLFPPTVARNLLVLTTLATTMPLCAALAQKGKPVQEFTRQGLLITNFAVADGEKLKVGLRAADAVRSRVEKLADKRATEVIDGDRIRDKMYRSAYDPDTTYTVDQILSIGHLLRADEYVQGTVTNDRGGVRLTATLVLMRDLKLRQPLTSVTAPTLDSAARLMAVNISATLVQLVHVRRCENALRERNGAQAVASAREGLGLYPNATLARICLAWALQTTGASYEEVLTVSREVLAIDPASFHAIAAAAVSLDSLHQREAAGDMWLRLAATDTTDVDLAYRVIFALTSGGNAKRAEPFVLKVSDAFPDHLPFIQQKWRVTYETKNWPKAVEAGEYLIAHDSLARSDSTFWLRLATAYKADGKPFKAIETLARSLTSFPNDVRIYALYTQYVRIEADSVIPRGLTLFPQSADLRNIQAKELRAHGKLQESLDATKQAVSLDSTIVQGELVIAQLEMELGRPDSALSSLRRGLARGADSTAVAQFAVAKGNVLFQAANGTHNAADFGLALRFFTFADSVHSSVQSTFLTGATALSLAQAALTEAPKGTDKVESCRLARLGADMMRMAKTGLDSGREIYSEAAKQYLDFLVQLDPYVGPQLAAYCAAPR